ncbi:MAG: hypothetical protein JWL65_7610 [Gammaproteobacteria bacterium]|nr:hypothetical protein [Gammaproteobacteria bacterium]
MLLLESILRGADLARRERAIEATKAMAEELERRVAQRTDQLRALVADLEATEDRQRRQIARDLHDDLGQTLAAARIRLTALCDDRRDDVRSQAQEVGALIDRASGAIHSLASQLAPDVLHELGLIPALEWLGEDIEHTFGLRVNMVDDGHPKPLAQEARSILYRAVRELLINVSRHALTDSATVESVCQDERIIIRVSDSGVGFDTARVFGEPRRGLGLLSLQERLALIGGSAEVHSVPGEGSHCVLTAPLQGVGSLPVGPPSITKVRDSLSDADRPRLARREREVLRLIAEGVRSPAIAEEMQVSVATIEVHRRNIMRKLGLRTVAELTKHAIREGIISL